MRIIAGEWGSRTLRRPRSDGTRPMPDRVKSAIFNMLGERYRTPGALPPLRIVDAFAGSGSMGLEALSRGAAWCRFIERDRTALAALQANITALGADGRSHVVVADAWQDLTAPHDAESVDLIILDPPYADSDDPAPGGPVGRCLEQLAALAAAPPLIVLHHRASARYPDDAAESWRAAVSRTYGTHGITFFTYEPTEHPKGLGGPESAGTP